MYKLVRKNDGLTKISEKVTFIEFDGNGLFLKQHDKADLNLSLLMSPFNRFFFTWQTTPITKILKNEENYLHFRTENSEYELFKEERMMDGIEADIYNDLLLDKYLEEIGNEDKEDLLLDKYLEEIGNEDKEDLYLIEEDEEEN